jgi:cysteinyl-tRNA synthetase
VLEAHGYTVKHIVNITDVGHLVSDADTGEDKMEKGATREGKTVWEIAQHYTDAWMENLEKLNILQAMHYPRATDHVSDMIAMVEQLERGGYTYRSSDGIYFNTEKFDAYCDFARLDPQQLRAGARIDMGEKRNVTDFALWKFSPTDAKRQMEWDSPWGVGFPGWHIECSAMALKYLEQPLDIHCGGIDHIRVHHTNEIAQAEAATGRKFVRFWCHGEFLVLDKAKMAKSSGEFITLDSLIKRGFDPIAYRLFCFSAHYRTPLTFSWDGIASAAQSLERLRKATAGLIDSDRRSADRERVEKVLLPFWEAVNDDLNMPRALAVLWDTFNDSSLELPEKAAAVGVMDTIFGLRLLDKEALPFTKTVTGPAGATVVFSARTEIGQERIDEIFTLIVERREARKRKDFSRADAIRDRFQNDGIELRDCPDGTTECVL